MIGGRLFSNMMKNIGYFGKGLLKGEDGYEVYRRQIIRNSSSRIKEDFDDVRRAASVGRWVKAGTQAVPAGVSAAIDRVYEPLHKMAYLSGAVTREGIQAAGRGAMAAGRGALSLSASAARLGWGGVGVTTRNRALWGRHNQELAAAIEREMGQGILGDTGVTAQVVPGLKQALPAAISGAARGTYGAARLGGEVVAEAGRMGWAGLRGAQRFSENGLLQAGVAIGATSIMVPGMYQAGRQTATLDTKLQAVGISTNAGGTFLRDTPPSNAANLTTRGGTYDRLGVNNHGADGNLVFALHTLRNGG